MNVHDKKNEFVGPQVIADILDVSRNTVLNWANQGKIPCLKVGRTYRFVLAEVLEVARNCSDDAA